MPNLISSPSWLDCVYDKLHALDSNTFYGLNPNVVNFWNYCVFFRVSSSFSLNKNSISEFFDVAIVRENAIPIDLCDCFIKNVCEVFGVKLADNNIDFSYVRKNNSDIIVEIAVIHFVHARKFC